MGRGAETERRWGSLWRGLPVMSAAIVWVAWHLLWTRIEGAAPSLIGDYAGDFQVIVAPIGAFLVGIGLGQLRISSESLLVPVLTHVAVVAALLLAT